MCYSLVVAYVCFNGQSEVLGQAWKIRHGVSAPSCYRAVPKEVLKFERLFHFLFFICLLKGSLMRYFVVRQWQLSYRTLVFGCSFLEYHLIAFAHSRLCLLGKDMSAFREQATTLF